MKWTLLFPIIAITVSQTVLAKDNNINNTPKKPTKKIIKKQNPKKPHNYFDKLADKGLQLKLTYTNNLLGNPIGGIRQGFAYSDSTALDIRLNFEKLYNWKGLSFHLSFLQRNGENLTNKYIGNLFAASQIFGGENFRMNALSLQKSTLNNKLILTAGRINAGDYFLQSPLYYMYVSNTYDGNPIGVFFNAPFPAYPNAQWGAYLFTQATSTIITKIAAFNTNTTVSKNKHHGFNFSLKPNNGTMLISELDLLNNENLCFINCHLPGRYIAGFMYFTGNKQKDLLTNQAIQGNYGFYYQLEQKLYQPHWNSPRGLSTFFAMEIFPENYNKIPLFYEGGAIYKGIDPNKANDALSLAFAIGNFSRRLQAAERIAGSTIQDYEGNIELNYRYHVMRWFYIQPDIQYIIHPNGKKTIPNAWVFGAQLYINLTAI